jgi:uncharacterized membrane protein
LVVEKHGDGGRTMSARDAQNLWLDLKQAALVEGDLPPTGAATAPWFVRVMLGVAGWIGAVFLLFFVGLGLRFVLESAVASMVVGLAACAAAGMLFRLKPDRDFVTQFALAVSLTGQGLVLVALSSWLKHQVSSIALAMAVFQAVLFILVPNFIHRVWATWMGACAVVFALGRWHLQAYGLGLLSGACAWVWLNEFQLVKHGTMPRAGGYGLVLALMSAAGMVAWPAGAWLWRAGSHRPPGSDYHLWIGAGLGGVALLWAVWRLLIREAVQPTSRTCGPILGAAGILAVATIKAPGLAPAVLILLLGYGNGNRVLSGLGVAALLGYLSFYYYSLESTLLYKSALMAATGLALLAARFMLQHLWPAPQPQEERHA